MEMPAEKLIPLSGGLCVDQGLDSPEPWSIANLSSEPGGVWRGPALSPAPFNNEHSSPKAQG